MGDAYATISWGDLMGNAYATISGGMLTPRDRGACFQLAFVTTSSNEPHESLSHGVRSTYLSVVGTKSDANFILLL